MDQNVRKKNGEVTKKKKHPDRKNEVRDIVQTLRNGGGNNENLDRKKVRRPREVWALGKKKRREPAMRRVKANSPKKRKKRKRKQVSGGLGTA